jgi:hypothetical protein
LTYNEGPKIYKLAFQLLEKFIIFSSDEDEHFMKDGKSGSPIFFKERFLGIYNGHLTMTDGKEGAICAYFDYENIRFLKKNQLKSSDENSGNNLKNKKLANDLKKTQEGMSRSNTGVSAEKEITRKPSNIGRTPRKPVYKNKLGNSAAKPKINVTVKLNPNIFAKGRENNAVMFNDNLVKKWYLDLPKAAKSLKNMESEGIYYKYDALYNVLNKMQETYDKFMNRKIDEDELYSDIFDLNKKYNFYCVRSKAER